MLDIFKPNEDLVKLYEKCIEAEKTYEQYKKKLQETCQHKVVIQSNFDSINVRICLNCKLEETGTRWSYSPTNWSRINSGIIETILGNNEDRMVLQVKPGYDFWSLRKPTTVYDHNH